MVCLEYLASETRVLWTQCLYVDGGVCHTVLYSYCTVLMLCRQSGTDFSLASSVEFQVVEVSHQTIIHHQTLHYIFLHHWKFHYIFLHHRTLHYICIHHRTKHYFIPPPLPLLTRHIEPLALIIPPPLFIIPPPPHFIDIHCSWNTLEMLIAFYIV